jgi:large subunit ribosomal protein L30e
MVLIQQIQTALKGENVVIGYKKSLEYLRNSSPKLVVISNNLQDDKKAELEHDAKLSGASIEVFEGDSKELGVICGKPFPMSALVIKK